MKIIVMGSVEWSIRIANGWTIRILNRIVIDPHIIPCLIGDHTGIGNIVHTGEVVVHRPVKPR